MEVVKSSDEIQKKLDSLVGESWLYNGRVVEVKGINRNDGQIRIVNQGNTIIFPEEKAEEKMEEFLPVEHEKEGAGEEKLALQVFQKDGQQMESLEDLLMENIQKIKKDPEYLPQAKAITNNVNSLLNINKQKIQMLREIRQQKS